MKDSSQVATVKSYMADYNLLSVYIFLVLIL